MISLTYQNVLTICVIHICLLIPSTTGQQCVTTANMVTPSDMLGPYYVEDSEMTNRIAPEDILSDPSQRLFVYGKVYDSNTCNTIPNIVVEAWYAGPEEDGYYQDDEFRGQVTTDSAGAYNFTLAFPTQYPTRPIIHVHYRLSTTSGDEILVTQMYFYGTESGYVTDRSERVLQAVDTTLDTSGARQAEFNFFIEYDASDGDGSGSGGVFQRLLSLITSIFATIFNTLS